VTKEDETKLTEDVLEILIANGGSEYVSQIQGSLRGSMRSGYTLKSGRRWSFSGGRCDFETTLKTLGFTLTYAGKSGGGNKTLVTL